MNLHRRSGAVLTVGLAVAGIVVIFAIVLSTSLTSVAAGEIIPTGVAATLFSERTSEVPPGWRVKSLPGGKAFLPVLYYATFSKEAVETPDGPRRFSDLPWARESIVRVRVGELQDPAVRKDLLERKSNPIMVFGEGPYGEPFMYPGRTPAEIDAYFQAVLDAKKEFGSRFLCWDYGEWSWGGVEGSKPTRELTASCESLNLSPPKNLAEAANWFNRRYDLVFKRYQDAGIPVFSWNNTSLNHYEARKGTSFTGNEIAYVNAAMDSTLIAFCRGAARQFDIPWGVYAAGFGGAAGHSSFWNSRSPEERHVESSLVRGPNTAVPMQEQKRTLYSTYMAGANFSIKENDSSQGMLSGYDPLTIDRMDPRVIALQPAKTYVGPYGQLWSELWDRIVTKRDRGTPYTPVALMFDANHGFVFKYSQTLALGAVPYGAAEEQIRAAVNTVFPWEGDPHASSPFGEIFDVITTEAPEPIIDSYRAIVLVGQPKVSPKLARALRSHVEQGGLLFAACEQLTPELSKLAGIADTGQLGQDSSYLRASDFYVYGEPAFEYHQVKLQGAQPLFVAGTFEQRSWPIATINRVGKGCVIVGTPVWMATKGDPTRMHGVFSEVLSMIARELAPVQVHGAEVKVLFNRNDAGWVVTLMNDRGTTIAPPGYKPAVREQDTAGVVLRPRFAFAGATEWLSEKQWPGGEAGQEIAVVLPPGEIRIIELRLK